ncbi:hypothetical protein FHX28_004755 [Clostridium beijerinckii]|nr:hypothetical protein [Clostridium beijerinckii]
MYGKNDHGKNKWKVSCKAVHTGDTSIDGAKERANG